jgi:hypothetical protein
LEREISKLESKISGYENEISSYNYWLSYYEKGQKPESANEYQKTQIDPGQSGIGKNCFSFAQRTVKKSQIFKLNRFVFLPF